MKASPVLNCMDNENTSKYQFEAGDSSDEDSADRPAWGHGRARETGIFSRRIRETSQNLDI